MAAAAGGSSSLQAELLEDISARLSADADRLRIHQVCAQWRASTAPLAVCRPWVIAGSEPWKEVGLIGEYSLWLPTGGRVACPGGAPAGLPYCLGAPRGWLVLADNERSPTRLVLWEPISKAEILLPSLPSVAQVFLSGDPLAPPPSGWTAVASQRETAGCGRHQRLFFWRPGDAGWSPLRERTTWRVDSAAFHRGRAYFINMMSWQLQIYDIDVSPAPTLVRDTSLYAPAVKVCSAHGPTSRHSPLGLYAVPCGGELLLVTTYAGRRRPPPAEVYRVDWAAEPFVEVRDRVRDLGDHSLFVGRGDAFSLSAREFPAIRRNCLYYVEHDRFMPQRWVTVIDLGSEARERIPYPGELRTDGTGLWRAYSWLCLRGPLLKQQ